LFSYRKGWYLYTPLMLLATAGLLVMGKKCAAGQWAIALYLAVEIYVLASWWSWWNGGSFGLRSFVDIYGIMALPLAALVDAVYRRRSSLKLAFGGLLAFLIYLNLLQTSQYTQGYINHTGMTREAYWLNFLRHNCDGACWQMLSMPDAQLARLGIYYNYYTGDDNHELRAMEEGEGKEQIRREIEGDPKLTRQIRKAARREDTSYQELLRQVVDRVYDTRTSP